LQAIQGRRATAGLPLLLLSEADGFPVVAPNVVRRALSRLYFEEPQ